MNRQYGALSGVAIFLIVLNHAIHFGLQVAPVEGGWFKVLVVLQALGAFAVPVFLFVSGAFLAYAAKEFSVTFVRSSLERILWPYIVWSAVFYGLIALAAGERYSAAGYVKNLLVGYPYHFIPLLVFWYLAAPAVSWIGRRHGALLLAGIGTWQAWLLALRFPAMLGVDGWPPAWATATVPPVLFNSMADWGIYFPLGLVTSLHGAAIKPRLERWRPAAAAATTTLFGLGLLNAFGVLDAGWARLVAPVPLMFILPTIDRGSIPLLSAFEWIGRRSYGIYLSHFVVINGIVLALGRAIAGLKVPALVVYPTLLLATLGLSLVLMEGLSSTSVGRRLYRHVFGIIAPARTQPRTA
ncbi:MAG: acyltransferase family protein [Vicinamibacterales bacterium]